MRVVVPFTANSLHRATAVALAYLDPQPIYSLLMADDDYFKLWSAIWSEQLTTINVEHDIAPGRGALEELWDCERDWCGFPYRYMDSFYSGMGCAKFSGDLMRAQPTALKQVYGMSDPDHPPGHWCRLDGWLKIVLEGGGARMHIHQPPVEHLSDGWPAHGCIRRPVLA